MVDAASHPQSDHLFGGRAAFVTLRDGWQLRTAVWDSLVSPVHGTLFFLNGRGDFLEKYGEFCRDAALAGFQVASWDWRGQGLSGRIPADQSRSHLESFDGLLADMVDILARAPLANLPKPWFLVAHSLGGHLALRHLQTDRESFAKAVLLAPMLGISTGPISPQMARRFVRLMCAVGQGGRYAPGQSDYGPLFRSRMRQLRLTGDARRFAQEGNAIKQNPQLAIGGVTMAWSLAAFQSIDQLLAADAVEQITTPILMLLAKLEHVVDSTASESLGARLPHAEVRTIAHGRHELLREVDSVRSDVARQIFDFLLA